MKLGNEGENEATAGRIWMGMEMGMGMGLADCLPATLLVDDLFLFYSVPVLL